MKALFTLFFLLGFVLVQASDDSSFDDEFNDDEPIETMIDPLSSYNEVMTGFNDYFYINALEPVVNGYAHIFSHEVRSSLHNFFNNLYSPISIVNNLLQFKVVDATEEVARFVLNSTIGIGGLFDPAKTNFNLEAHAEDFGQTLGVWGVGSGFHIVLPFFGPSNLRDSLGIFADYYINPLNRIEPRGHNMISTELESFAIGAAKSLSTASQHKGEYAAMKKDALDLYPFLRDVYEQHRNKVIGE